MSNLRCVYACAREDLVVSQKEVFGMLEKEIERHLRDGVKNMGGYCLKMVCPGFTGMPDRMILLKGGKMAFVELKRPGQKERQRQKFVQSRLRKLGFRVFESVDSWQKVDDILCWCALIVAGVEHGV